MQTKRRFRIRERISELVRLINTGDSGGMLVQPVLNLLVDMGFERTRFYEIAFDVPRQGTVGVLTAHAPFDTGTKSFLGYQAPYDRSTLAIRKTQSKPVVVHDSEFTGSARPDWIEHLHLKGKSWVEVPVIAVDNVIGVIACDWSGPPSELDDVELRILSDVGYRIGPNIALSPSRRIAQIQKKMDTIYQAARSLRELIESVAIVLAESLNAAITAVFRYEWTTDSLLKVFEYPNPRLALPDDPFPEAYAVGEYLTGKAWQDPDYRYIVDFDSLIHRASERVAQPSLTRHTRLLGNVKTVLYAVIGRTEGRFLLRLMNRADQPMLPFLSERTVLDAFTGDISAAADAMVARLRLSRLQSLARGAVEQTGNPSKIFSLVREGLIEDNLESFAMFCHAMSDTNSSLVAWSGDALKDFPRDIGIPWRNDSLLLSAVEHGEVHVVDVAHFPDAQNLDRLAGQLNHRGYRNVLVFPIQASQTRGVLLIPLSRTGEKRRGRLSAPQIRQRVPETFDMITAYSTLAASAFGVARSHVRAQWRAVGYIGHEIGTPMAALGDIAVEAVTKAQMSLAKPDELTQSVAHQRIEQLEALFNEINDLRAELDQFLGLALLVAQESRGRLQLHFARRPLYKVLQSAKERAPAELRLVEDLSKAKRYVIELSESCERLPQVVCDEHLLRQVFVNLLRNAIKYSLPRYSGQPMVIRVTGQPQTGMSIVQIENWGLGIPPDQRDDIFKPFVRGEVEDRLKAIRGMGLGLFLAQRIMVAHQGDVVLRYSRPTLDDPKRLQLLEGFETVFEIRLPHTLKEGTVTHMWEEVGA